MSPSSPVSPRHNTIHQVESAESSKRNFNIKHGLQLTDYDDLHQTCLPSKTIRLEPYLRFVFNVHLCNDSSHVQSINITCGVRYSVVASDVSWYHAGAVAVIVDRTTLKFCYCGLWREKGINHLCCFCHYWQTFLCTVRLHFHSWPVWSIFTSVGKRQEVRQG